MRAAPTVGMLCAWCVGVMCSGCADVGEVRSGSGIEGPGHYELLRIFEVPGRQGIATDGKRYYNSGSTALYVYSKDGELLRENPEPFIDLEKPANHIGDISVHEGELFAGIECFEDGRGADIQIAVYDAETLRYKKSVDWQPDSGQLARTSHQVS